MGQYRISQASINLLRPFVLNGENMDETLKNELLNYFTLQENDLDSSFELSDAAEAAFKKVSAEAEPVLTEELLYALQEFSISRE